MFELAKLKSKKLPELQEIAKTIGLKRITGLKKLELIDQIIDSLSTSSSHENGPKEPTNESQELNMNGPGQKNSDKTLNKSMLLGLSYLSLYLKHQC